MRIQGTREGAHSIIRTANPGNPTLPDQAEAIFERFPRSGTVKNISGHGLGLNIAREPARAHRGELALKADPQETVFVLSLPATS